jgi:putative DNA primase/helicase
MSARPNSKLHSFPLSDSGNAELIASLFAHRLRFDHRQKTWLVWKGSFWAEDSDGEAYRMAKTAARARFKHANDLCDDEKRRAEIRWALQSESQYHLRAALELAKHTAPIADPGSNWDSDPLLLGVHNGVVDLRTGYLRTGSPEDRVTRRTVVPYDPSACCPQFEQFLCQVFLGEVDIIRFVQKAIGYSLTGDVREQCLFLCYGDGSNGKTTLLETVRSLLAGYAHNLPFSAFELTARSAVPNDIAGLVSKRFVTAVETRENLIFNEGRVKALTGGDFCTARFLYGEFFSFDPTAKFWLAFNHKPRVTDDSHGFWRRVRLIPFRAKFGGADEVKNFGSKLRAEASGILAWAVRGCLSWQREGLGLPPAICEATSLYQKESDHLEGFLEDLYELCPGGFTKCSDINHEYATWTKQNGEIRLNVRAFAARLRGRGCVEARSPGKERIRGWKGLKRKTNQIPDSPDVRTSADMAIQ